ncbi:terminase family protein [Xinfangfangia sp. CPCC 101601]|uniref:Terminase family protein n=1 Tax=Pseudogemmobacter lacusdianii TaxID=3069608 RepID=A0ABU0W2N1_9RHOB|nr:terminase family protein [Xinfangfangia sp. CPCC 101601]MDQ2067705.1 terminase family protein [Xinfangfangia sp. CPCC 101601]
MKSGAVWLSSAQAEEIDAFLGGLSEATLLALPWVFDFWALPHQLPPEGAWTTWVVMGGRGAGKTRAGAEWVRRQVEGAKPSDPGRARRVALVAETLDQGREVMVLGDSGILASSPPDRRPKWISTRNTLVWPNGAEARVFSAHDPEALRGPQFDAAWADELAKWPKAQATWDQLQFGLRLGENPQQIVTTTPRNVEVLKAILKNPSTVITHAPTEANRAYLASSFLREVQARFGGTLLGRQELLGELVEDVPDALWTVAMIAAARAAAPVEVTRVVVAVDPPVTATKVSDECGIVVVGADTRGDPSRWRAVVLADRSVKGASPDGWARAALAAVEEFGAERLVAEVNQGGDLVQGVIRQIDPLVPFRAVRAMRNKMLRAEPVAALYEQGRVAHLAHLDALEGQMMQMARTGWKGQASPDRLDALVWALTDLVVDQAGRMAQPGLRTL